MGALRGRRAQAVWFIGLWLAGVAALALVGGVIKWALGV